MRYVTALVALATVATCSFSASLLSAEETSAARQWELRNYHTVRIDRKHDDDHTYLTRLELPWRHRIAPDWDVTLILEPFGETRYKWEPEQWSRSEAGIEAGVQLTRFGYIGESIRRVGEYSADLAEYVINYLIDEA